MSLLEFCKNLPKIELHAHLNGSLSKNTLIALGIPLERIENYQINRTQEEDVNKLNDCFKLFQVAHEATSTLENVFYATQSVIKEFHSDNVIYLELRTTPRQGTNMTKRQYIETVVKAIKENNNSIMVKLILSIDRAHDLKDSEETLELIIEMRGRFPEIIKAVDLCGNPYKGKFHESLFAKAREAGLKITLHCGEIKNDEEVLTMLRFKPERIGHACYLHPNFGGSDDLWEVYRKDPIPAEICLTSNVLCGTSKTYREHHLREWLESDLPFCLNTDDKGVFCKSLSEEFYVAGENFHLSKERLLECCLSSVKYSFASEEEKFQLREILKTRYCHPNSNFKAS